MPWEETDSGTERLKFIAAFLEGEETFTELCSQFWISRKTGYKWVKRYQDEGIGALADRSRAPLSHPHAVSDQVVKQLVAFKRKHRGWGPRKLKVALQKHDPRVIWPAASTIGDILRRHGLTSKRRRIRRSTPYASGLRGYDRPNAVWCADFKGHFRVDRYRCHPLTISDGFSRFLLSCKALSRPSYRPSRQVFESVFREYGLPETIRTDNGSPFSSLANGGLSALAVWWIRLGIRPERIMPGRPDQNGRHERMHRTLKAETARPARSSFRAQQRAFDLFRKEYNYERPHEALHQEVPADVYSPSPRPYPSRLPKPEYPSHFQVLDVYHNGSMMFAGSQWYVSGCLRDERVGLEECGNDCWRVYFSWLPFAMLDLKKAGEIKNGQMGPLVPLRNPTEPRRRKRRRTHR
jgi:transposase InsO family protein